MKYIIVVEGVMFLCGTYFTDFYKGELEKRVTFTLIRERALKFDTYLEAVEEGKFLLKAQTFLIEVL